MNIPDVCVRARRWLNRFEAWTKSKRSLLLLRLIIRLSLRMFSFDDKENNNNKTKDRTWPGRTSTSEVQNEDSRCLPISGILLLRKGRNGDHECLWSSSLWLWEHWRLRWLSWVFCWAMQRRKKILSVQSIVIRFLRPRNESLDSILANDDLCLTPYCVRAGRSSYRRRMCHCLAFDSELSFGKYWRIGWTMRRFLSIRLRHLD